MLRSYDCQGMCWLDTTTNKFNRDLYSKLLVEKGYSPVSDKLSYSHIEHLPFEWQPLSNHNFESERDLEQCKWKLYQYALAAVYSREDFEYLCDFAELFLPPQWIHYFTQLDFSLHPFPARS